MPFTEEEILNQLDLAFKGIPNEYYPIGNIDDIKYNFIFDLEHGYFETASSKIHLYADANRWAIICEKAGYRNREGVAVIELNYFGNCIDYTIDKYPERNYITNVNDIMLISDDEYERISDTDEESFELVSSLITEINVRDKRIKLEYNLSEYKDLGIIPKSYGNPKNLISFGDLIRYLNETDPSTIAANEKEIKEHIPVELPKIMEINAFHFGSVYDDKNLPSTLEMYKLIAKVLTKQDSSLWRPTLEPNNHWSNWESGNL